jgi:very-short-patch-repair endonuclease
MPDESRKLTDQIAQRLSEEGISFKREVAIGGLRIDFLIYGPRNRKVVIEVKAWDKYDGFRNRAAHQVNLYKEAVGADDAFLVIESLERSSVEEGVVTPDKLIPAILDALSQDQVSKWKKKREVTAPARHVFAAMPFDQKYDDVYFVAMCYAAQANRATSIRVDQREFSGDIVVEIHRLIEDSIAVIADLSESLPNVLYEVGYAHALKKPTLHICSTALEGLPFDVSHWNTIQYHAGQTHQLRDTLARRLRSAIPR